MDRLGQGKAAAAGPRIERCNMFIELVLTICLADRPASCREEHLNFEDGGGPVTCMLQAPPQIAKWSAEHPKQRVVKWRCEYSSKEREI
ncbi:hypothetical protein M8R20_12980 [Pseudomonas sp. R2.Fl]|nr:hypothetical protein [Pseudomonas sp. R2.Fl]